MAMQNLDDLLVHQLRDILSAERQIRRALPRMAKASKSDKLREALESHVEETDQQIERLRKAFDLLGKSARASHCEGAEGLITEAEEFLDGDGHADVRDAGLITAAQRVEHYEMAAYGSAIAFARMLDKDDVVSLLEETLEEEKAADRKLTKIAEGSVNEAAMKAGNGRS
jgi:ferritin-like metal-binding protein YciE